MLLKKQVSRSQKNLPHFIRLTLFFFSTSLLLLSLLLEHFSLPLLLVFCSCQDQPRVVLSFFSWRFIWFPHWEPVSFSRLDVRGSLVLKKTLPTLTPGSENSRLFSIHGHLISVIKQKIINKLSVCQLNSQTPYLFLGELRGWGDPKQVGGSVPLLARKPDKG